MNRGCRPHHEPIHEIDDKDRCAIQLSELRTEVRNAGGTWKERTMCVAWHHAYGGDMICLHQSNHISESTAVERAACQSGPISVLIL